MTILLTVSACSSGEAKSDPESVTAESRTCEEVLGDAGVDWLKDKAGSDRLLMRETNDQQQARALIYKQMRSWEPKDSADTYDPYSFTDAHVCGAGKKDDESGAKFNLRYDASQYPFSEIPGDEGKAPAPGNADVKFAVRQDRGSSTAYTVYFKCAIPGARPEQEEQLPIAAIMTDTLTGDRDSGVHFRHLLHSVQVMARTLDCQNKPDIPTEPPSSVK
ncbi:hypothetical protein [Streptomyces sp. A5-4]|uniref:hypothetical protein n=1 Tax=Streptomyces sp. A5-4 TaxID=3384771 RepID=UPI003DA7EFAA